MMPKLDPKAEAMFRRMAKELYEDPALFGEFYCAASEIVDDFEEFGPHLFGTEEGQYDESTPIGKLQRARNELIVRSRLSEK